MIPIALAVAGILAVLLLLRLRSDERVRLPEAAVAGTLDSVEAAILAGRKIEAIKLYREEHGVGLKEAKEAVEAIQRSMRSR
jgi:ribosomal protein L7/L12